MSAARIAAAAVLGVALGTTAGCRTPPTPYDYGPYLAHMPHSILVLPPLNESLEVTAPCAALSVVTRPIAERGYYVFPVALVDAYMKENGLPTPAEMHAVPLEKLREVFGADAVLYLNVTDWGTSYQVLNSRTSVAVTGRLVDLWSGALIWERTWAAARNSSSGQDNVVAMLLVALIQQIVDTSTDAAHDLADASSEPWVASDEWGMLAGPRSPSYAADQARRDQATKPPAPQTPAPSAPVPHTPTPNAPTPNGLTPNAPTKDE